MKKLLIFALMFALASCGLQTSEENKNDKDVNQTQESDFYTYTFITPKNDPNIFGFGLHIPEGYKIDEELYGKTGALLVRSPDKKSSFSLVAVTNYSHNDAFSFINNDVIAVDKSSIYGQVITEQPWTTPFPGEEDVTHCEASFASVEFETKVQEVDFSGETRVNWFDAIQKKSGSIGFVFNMQAPKTDWKNIKPIFELIRKSLVWLPSVAQVQATLFRTNDKKTKIDQKALNDFEYRMLQLENGTAFGPGWDTIFEEYTISQDKEANKFYLVKNIQTPSGLLPNPVRQGMTVSKVLPKEIFSYLVEITTLKNP